jgi:hypothetical protein
MNQKERLVEVIESARYWGSGTSAEIADKILADGWMRPPCKVGDYVYDISEFFDGTTCPEIYEYRVDRIEITEEKGQQVLYIADLKYPSDEWGKSLHFSREDAEKALRGDEGK